jgi:hypothetical protein
MLKLVPLHTELTTLGLHYYENGGSASVSRTLFRGDKNKHYDKIHTMILARGYKRVVFNEYGSSEYVKKLNEGRNTATVKIAHTPDGHVYSVSTITYHNHY